VTSKLHIVALYASGTRKTQLSDPAEDILSGLEMTDEKGSESIEDLEIRYLWEERNVQIDNYQELAREIEASSKSVLADRNLELLALCHRTLYFKMGIAKISLDDLHEILIEDIDEADKTIPWLIREYTTITGLLANLAGSLDILAREIDLIYNLKTAQEHLGHASPATTSMYLPTRSKETYEEKMEKVFREK